MKVQYHHFCPDANLEQAVLCVEDTQKLNTLSVQELVQLKAELYGKHNLSNDELAAFFNVPHKNAFSSLTKNEKQRVDKALLRLDVHARRRMLKIAADFKHKTPSASKQDVYALSFVFRHGSNDMKTFPEVRTMNAEASWFYHQKLIGLKKSVWKKFLSKKIFQIKSNFLSHGRNLFGFESVSDKVRSPLSGSSSR